MSPIAKTNQESVVKAHSKMGHQFIDDALQPDICRQMTGEYQSMLLVSRIGLGGSGITTGEWVGPH